jgi:geranylgeranyl diphosphate synthase type II
MPLACALEIIHTYSLIHDDLPAMDNDVMRRGRPTHHVVFGEAMAILTGDALLNLAYELMLEHVPQDSTRAAGYLAAAGTIAHAAGAEGMVAGQCMDMMMEHGQATLEALEQMQRAKTGALFSAAMLGGALAGGAGQAELAAVRDYAEHAGMLFQIVDDILDVVGDEKSLGKSVGKDEQAGKCTYVTMLGLDGARAQAAMHRDQAASFARIFDKEGFFSQFVIDLYQRDQ